MGLLARLRGGPVGRVRMIASVGAHVAGEQYDLPAPVADRYIARGYAAGSMRRHFEPEELAALRANSQTVSL